MCTVRPQDTEKRAATARTAIDNRALCTDTGRRCTGAATNAKNSSARYLKGILVAIET